MLKLLLSRLFAKLIFLTALLAPGASWANDVYVIGTARDLSSDKVIYTENHCLIDNRRYVEYLDSEDRLIAHKVVDYQSGLITPTFVQHNLDLQDVIKVEPTAAGVEMQRRKLSDGVDDRPVKKTLNKKLNLVIDAGFDNFIRKNWQQLVEGDVMTFQFPAAARVDLFNFKVNKMNCSSGNENHQCFNLRLDSWLMRMLVDPIQLAYDKKNMQLMRFRGLGNLEDKRGRGYKVDMHYRYDDLQGRQCSAERSTLEAWL